MITSILSMENEDIVAVHHNMRLTVADLATLGDGKWINDEV